MPSKYTVGQKLWVVFSQYRLYGDPRETTIIKVGRKWLELENGHRAKIDTLVLDGGQYNSPGACYLSREPWEAKVLLNTQWQQLRRDIDRAMCVPDGVNTEDIQNARLVLGMPDAV